MAGIYGNSQEDKHFESMLMNHLDNFDSGISGSISFEDFQIDLGVTCYAIDGVAYMSNGVVDYVEIALIERYCHDKDVWIKASLDFNKIAESLAVNEDFLEFIGAI